VAFEYGMFFLCWYLLSPVCPDPDSAHCLAGSVKGSSASAQLPSSQPPLLDHLRFQVVYLALLPLSLIGLPLMLAHTDLSSYVIQAIFGVFGIVAAYIGNKYFTFRKTREASEQAE